MTAIRPLRGELLDTAAVTPAPVPVGTPDQVRLLKAIADPIRLRLLGLIAAAPPGGICVCDIVAEFDLTQPTISHHLKQLRDVDLVDSHRQGTWAYYALRPGSLEPLQALLAALDAAHLAPVVTRIERAGQWVDLTSVHEATR